MHFPRNPTFTLLCIIMLDEWDAPVEESCCSSAELSEAVPSIQNHSVAPPCGMYSWSCCQVDSSSVPKAHTNATSNVFVRRSSFAFAGPTLKLQLPSKLCFYFTYFCLELPCRLPCFFLAHWTKRLATAPSSLVMSIRTSRVFAWWLTVRYCAPLCL